MILPMKTTNPTAAAIKRVLRRLRNPADLLARMLVNGFPTFESDPTRFATSSSAGFLAGLSKDLVFMLIPDILNFLKVGYIWSGASSCVA